MSAAAPLAALDGEALSYGANRVFAGVSLTLEPGERVVLLGRSGAGKSTLLAALYDRLTGAGRRTALVPQDHALVPQLSVLRNALMGRLDDHGAAYNLTNLIRPRAADRAAVAAILADVGLSAQIDRPVEALSGGQKQRTALARAFHRGGEVLIADEPVSAVDEAQAGALLDACRDRFPTAVLALHDVAQARAFGTRLIGLRAGQVAFDAAPGGRQRSRDRGALCGLNGSRAAAWCCCSSAVALAALPFADLSLAGNDPWAALGRMAAGLRPPRFPGHRAHRAGDPLDRHVRRRRRRRRERRRAGPRAVLRQPRRPRAGHRACAPCTSCSGR